MKRLFVGIAAVTLAAGMSLPGFVPVGVHAQGGTTQNASQLCSQNKDQVFGANVPISHGACVSTIQSQGHSSALYASLCQYLVRNNQTVSGAGLTPASWLDSTTQTNITNILNAVGSQYTKPFANVGQCVSAFNRAKTGGMTTNGHTGKTGGKLHGKGSKHGKAGKTGKTRKGHA